MKSRLDVDGVIAQDEDKLTQVDWSSAETKASVEKLWAKGISLYKLLDGDYVKHEIEADQCLYNGIVLTAKAVTEFWMTTNGWEDTFLPEYEWMHPGRGEKATWIKEDNIWVGLTQIDVFEYGEATDG